MNRHTLHHHLNRLLAWWRAMPLVFVILLTALLALPIWVMKVKNEKRAKELYYPLSHFPMYSDFTDWDYVVYLADAQGNPLAMETLTGGVRVARTKKKYNSLLNERLDQIRDETGTAPSKENTPEEIKREVGQQVLEYIIQQWEGRRPSSLAQHPRLRLYLQDITQSDGKVRPGKPQLVGQWSAIGSAPTPPQPSSN